MQKKRNIREEIQTIRSRSKFSTFFEYSERLYSIKKSYEKIDSADTEFIKYIPISIVACLESFFRDWVKQIIDYPTPFNQNISKFNQTISKLDFVFLAAIQTKNFTVGEFVSHQLPYNNFEEIAQNLSILLDFDFIEKLKTGFVDYGNDIEITAETAIISIKKIYELRHIFCHEFAPNFRVNKEEILELLNHCDKFLLNVDATLEEKLYPYEFKTQVQLNKEANESYLKKEKELKELVANIRTINCKKEFRSFEDSTFVKQMKDWKKYRKSFSEMVASRDSGDENYKLLYLYEMENKTEEKIEILKKEFEILLNPFYYS